MGQPLHVAIAHDFTCPWCWIGLIQAKRLQSQFGVEIEWRGHELWPEELEWPESRPSAPIPDKPATPSRLDFIKMLDEVEVPPVERPKRMRVHTALEAVEYVKEHAPESVDAFVEDVYRAYWERGERIGDVVVIAALARPYISDLNDFEYAMEERQYREKVVHFDAPSYKSGVFNVPTFFIGDARYAEQPYVVLERAVAELTSGETDVYSILEFPKAPTDRPYTYINMVATIDGKIITGGRSEPVVDLGSSVDHKLMKRIEAASDAVLLGAQTLRAAKKSWNPQSEIRVVVTESGNLPFDSCFFTGKSVIASENDLTPPEGTDALHFTDLAGLLKTLKGRGIERLLVLGGSTLNAQLFEKELIDEIFITIAPKIKLGSDVPTIAGGNALPRERIQNYSVVEEHRIGDELFVRYRRNS